jgi:hypothetical protein
MRVRGGSSEKSGLIPKGGDKGQKQENYFEDKI